MTDLEAIAVRARNLQQLVAVMAEQTRSLERDAEIAIGDRSSFPDVLKEIRNAALHQERCAEALGYAAGDIEVLTTDHQVPA